MKHLAVVMVGVTLGAFACGGRVMVDRDGGAGGGGASSGTGAGGGGCPDPFPGIQAPCDHEQLTCPVPGACCPGTATCKGGIWTFPGPDCNSLCPVVCGPNDFGCESVCIVDVTSMETFRCAPNPCDGTVACGCATPLCTERGEQCADVSGFTLTCSK